ncbi:hypothetical protein FHS82_000373 [Pseudochelatococcus lubricantis]|uniref:SGNH/GDSL hydrolase family protein n=1 Tax=Pseudochelatococcus lubricantis TaxID=1538102 RepID=A0ABX0UY87_9HYPH|nr:hypothetical protein [Pseudochelatococcus lubricantis]NIJ56560.1 hypothetical protein [Pseudochelatococcus lubricantis]
MRHSLPWRRFLKTFLLALVLVGAALAGFVATVDPYGIRVRAGDAPRPVVDINQRYMYPQIARSRRYDAAIFGTSSLRLLDPEELDRLFGTPEKPVHFANLAMNAATPWEQMQLARLFVKVEPAPRVLVFGLDRGWCDADADAPERRLTFRAFPVRFYDDDPWNDWRDAFSLNTLEIAGRLVSHRLGLRGVNLRDDGYGVFVPPDAAYDLERARTHIWHENLAAGLPAAVVPVEPPAVPTAADRAAWRFPAGQWLDGLLAALPADTQTFLVFPPAHVAAQPRPGSLAEAMEQACKRHFAELGARHNATVLDFRRPSAVTREDANFWDPLHYRLPFASRIGEALANPQPSDDFYVVMHRRAPSLPSSGQ